MSIPSKNNPKLAEMQFKEDLVKVLANTHSQYNEWNFTPDYGNLHLYVDMWAFDENHCKLDDFHIDMDMSYYRNYPPGVTFINPDTKSFDPCKDMRWLPRIAPRPTGINIRYHPKFRLNTGQTKQLICNSMILEYYQTEHTPTGDQRWSMNRHTFFATLDILQMMLFKPHYWGRSD